MGIVRILIRNKKIQKTMNTVIEIKNKINSK